MLRHFGVTVVLALALMPGGMFPVAAASMAETFSPFTRGSKVTVDHSRWDRLLKRYGHKDHSGLNRVDYRAFKARSHGDLKAYLRGLGVVDVKTLDRAEQFAFWVNLYNAKTVDVVLDHYPVPSIRNISINEGVLGFLKTTAGVGGPWQAKIVSVGGQRLSLDDIEHGILRPVFMDPRVHYAINCASIGCPKLSRDAFTGANLQVLLDAGARAYVNGPRGVSVDAGGVTASSIYKWFQADFGGSDTGVLAHLRKYASGDLRRRLKGVTRIGAYHYDWALNDAAR